MATIRILDPLTGRVVLVDLPLPAAPRPAPRPAVAIQGPPRAPGHGTTAPEKTQVMPPSAVPAA